LEERVKAIEDAKIIQDLDWESMAQDIPDIIEFAEKMEDYRVEIMNSLT